LSKWELLIARFESERTRFAYEGSTAAYLEASKKRLGHLKTKNFDRTYDALEAPPPDSVDRLVNKALCH